MCVDSHSEGQRIPVDHEKYTEGITCTTDFISDFAWAYKKSLTSLKQGGEDGCSFEINIDKKFNWFQKKMLKMFFGFEVEENEKNE